ncbi:hypothetical protein ACHAWF_000883, partial [Thalassiosira exigua]
MDISTVSVLVFFLLRGGSLPQDHGAMIFWQIVPTSGTNNMSSTRFPAAATTIEFKLVGVIANHKPSGVFRTGWSMHDQLSSALNSPLSTITINLGVSIEPLDHVQNVGMIKDKTTPVAK